MKIAIIGAGITGLSLAYFLSRAGNEIVIFEKDNEIGGLAGFFKVNGTYLEKYYHHSFHGHKELLELFNELKIHDHFISYGAKTGFYYDKKIYPFASGKDLLFFKPLKVIDRLRLGLSSLLMVRINDWKNIEKTGAIDWLRKYSGNKASNIVWQPLLKSKFGDDFEQISAAWLWNRVVDRKGGNGKEILGYLDGGYKVLLTALTENIISKGGKILTDTQVKQIQTKNGKNEIVFGNDESMSANIIVSTIPIPYFLSIVPNLPNQYITDLESVKYQGSTCVVLKLNKSLSDYYWINVSDPDCPFVGIIEHTNFVSPKYYDGKHFVYLTKYTSSDSEIFNNPRESIYNEFVMYLKKMFINLKDNEIEKYWVFQDRYSQPVFIKNYSSILPNIKTPVKDLYFLNISQIYPQSRCLNSSIVQAKDLARIISKK